MWFATPACVGDEPAASFHTSECPVGVGGAVSLTAKWAQPLPLPVVTEGLPSALLAFTHVRPENTPACHSPSPVLPAPLGFVLVTSS